MDKVKKWDWIFGSSIVLLIVLIVVAYQYGPPATVSTEPRVGNSPITERQAREAVVRQVDYRISESKVYIKGAYKVGDDWIVRAGIDEIFYDDYIFSYNSMDGWHCSGVQRAP